MKWRLLAVACAIIAVVSAVVGYKLVQFSLYDDWEQACVQHPLNHSARFVFVDAQLTDGRVIKIEYCIDDNDDYVNHRELL